MRWPATLKTSHRNPRSTIKNAGGLYFWDRNETRCNPTAMVAEPNMNIKRTIMQSKNTNKPHTQTEYN